MRKKLIAALVGMAMTACLTATAASTYTTLDVTAPGSSGVVNGATFGYANPQPTGTGFIDPFLREQENGTSGVEAGVNTSIKAQVMDDLSGVGNLPGVFWDDKNPVNFTHDLAISTLVPTGNSYRFFLDVNQVANLPISLTTFKLFVSPIAYTDATALNNFLGSATPVYDMNAGAKGNPSSPFTQVITGSQHGSGSGDMFVDVPTTGITGNNFLYMVAIFGERGSTDPANSGFEEWWTASSVPVPDSASALSLLGIAITGIEMFRRKFRA